MCLLQRSQRCEILGMLFENSALEVILLPDYILSKWCFIPLAYEQRKVNAISSPFSYQQSATDNIPSLLQQVNPLKNRITRISEDEYFLQLS